MQNGQSPTLPRGRLMFALDATASREPTWAIARDLQAKMFREAAPIGRLDCPAGLLSGRRVPSVEMGVKRGATRATDEPDRLSGRLYADWQGPRACTSRDRESRQSRHWYSSATPWKRTSSTLAAMAGKLGTQGVPIFLFQEGRDAAVRSAFRLLALKSGGAYFEFNPDASRAVEQLSEQLNAVARLAVGDAEALERIGATADLTDQRASAPGRST